MYTTGEVILKKENKGLNHNLPLHLNPRLQGIVGDYHERIKNSKIIERCTELDLRSWKSDCCGENVYSSICAVCRKECKRETLYQEIESIMVRNKPNPGSNGGRDVASCLDMVNNYYSGYGVYDYARYLKDHNDL